ncbi:MAG: zinc-binding dehydrogenase [Actinomycetota bacterium]|nr:zinc-binding dehydrogenase [Actinomycetota bacterium]
MKAVLIENGTVRFAETDDPKLGDEQLLVKVAAAGINAADLMQAAGSYPPPPGIREDIPGLEFAGTVVAQGSLVPGDMLTKRVMGVVGGAAQAELVVVHYSSVIAVPDRIGLVEAGGIPEAYVTAFDALFTQAGLAVGERVLVRGASGGVGSAAVAMAVLAGAETLGTSRSEEGRAYLESMVAKAIHPDEVLGNGPFDVVLELIGGMQFHSCLSELRSRGRIVIIGVGQGSRVDLDLRLLMMKRAIVRASTLRPRSQGEKSEIARQFSERILPHLASGTLKPNLQRTYAAEEAPRAYSDFAALPKQGKLVLAL